MPIDPKKFREKVTNHLENITEEEFLENLHKSSPYLFTERLKEQSAIHKSSSFNTNLNEFNLDNHCIGDINNTKPLNTSKTIPIFYCIDNYIKNDKTSVGILPNFFPSFYKEKIYTHSESLVRRNRIIAEQLVTQYEFTDLELARDVTRLETSRIKAASSVLFVLVGILVMPITYIFFVHTDEFITRISSGWAILIITEAITKKLNDIKLWGQESRLCILECAIDMAGVKTNESYKHLVK